VSVAELALDRGAEASILGYGGKADADKVDGDSVVDVEVAGKNAGGTATFSVATTVGSIALVFAGEFTTILLLIEGFIEED
jgi:hypothetical protein